MVEGAPATASRGQEAAQIGRALWLSERKKGIGGTDAAAILGVSRWSSELQVWLDKRGEGLPVEESEPMKWGRAVEEAIATEYAIRHGRLLWNPEGVMAHPEHPILIGTPDRIVLDTMTSRPAYGLEIKTSRYGDGFGDSGSQEVPHDYAAQCAHYMAITGAERWDLAVLIGGNEYREYTLERDPDLEAAMVDRLLRWWQRHIVEGVRPEIDGSEATRRWLHQKYPKNVGSIAPAGAADEAVAAKLAQAREAQAAWERVRDECENKLKAVIGDAEGLAGSGWKATWKLAKGRVVTDWQAVAAEIAEQYSWATVFEREHERARFKAEALAAAAEKFTAESAGSRRFLFRATKEGS